jgi:hypothetical protein
MIAEGTYEAMPVAGSLQFANSGKKGTPQVAVDLKIVDGDEAGRVIQWIGYFTENTFKRTVESLQYMGMKGEDLDLLHDTDLKERVQIVVRHEDYNGSIRPRVQWVNRLGGFRFENQLGKDELKALSQQIRGWAKAPDTAAEPDF